MTMWGRIILLTQLVVLILLAMTYTEMASAHARFAPDGIVPPRSTEDGIKTGPCGNYPRSPTPTTLEAGQQITVEWEETINHPGYFRIAFSPADDLGFDDNVLYQVDDTQNGTGDLPHRYSADITLPNTACEACTLQLIQYMTENDPPRLYYSCADIRLVSNTSPDNVQNVLSATGKNEISMGWQYPAAGNLNVMIVQSDAPLSGSPVNKQGYQVGDTIGNATVVYLGNGAQYAATNLNPEQTYYYTIYTVSELNLYSSGVAIQETVPSIITDDQPPQDISSLTSVAGNANVEMQWINPVDDFYKVVILWDTNPIAVAPVNGVRYDIGEQIGTSYVVFNGLGNSATITNLLNGQNHYFKIYAHDGNFNYAGGVESTVFLSGAGVNEKPQLSISLTQNGNAVTHVYHDRGPVTISLQIQDDNNIAQAVISWNGTDPQLVDTDSSDQTFTFDPSALEDGTYIVNVAVVDSGNPPESAVITVGIQVINATDNDTKGAGGLGHMVLLLFLLLLQRYYARRTRMSY